MAPPPACEDCLILPHAATPCCCQDRICLGLEPGKSSPHVVDMEQLAVECLGPGGPPRGLAKVLRAYCMLDPCRLHIRRARGVGAQVFYVGTGQRVTKDKHGWRFFEK